MNGHLYSRQEIDSLRATNMQLVLSILLTMLVFEKHARNKVQAVPCRLEKRRLRNPDYRRVRRHVWNLSALHAIMFKN